jgi:hypothetical protein
MERYHPYGYHKRQPVYMPRPFDPVDTARYEAEERAWNEERSSWYRPFPSLQAWYANGCLPQRGPAGWLMVSPKWRLQGNPTSPIYANQPEEERGLAMYSPTACRMSPLTLGPSRKPDAPPPQGSVLLETIAKGRSLLFECGVGEQEAKKGVEVAEEDEEEEEGGEVVFSHAPDPHASSEDEDAVPLSHFVVGGKLKEAAPPAPPPEVEPGVYMDDDEAENGKFAWKWTPAEPAAKVEEKEAERVEEKEAEKGGGGGGGDSDFYDD